MNRISNNKMQQGKELMVWGTAICAMFIVLSSCNNVPESPGWEYMPDMYRSTSYETDGQTAVFADSMVNRPTVEGTITQGRIPNSEYSMLKMPYPYNNDSAGYESAGHHLKNPFPASEEVIAFGKDRFEKFCMHCHGGSGKGDGSVVEKGNFPPPPAFDSPLLKTLPAGKMFHTLQYGKGMMGSHASQLSREERWKVIRYVQTLQGGATAMVAPKDPEVSATPVASSAPANEPAESAASEKTVEPAIETAVAEPEPEVQLNDSTENQ